MPDLDPRFLDADRDSVNILESMLKAQEVQGYVSRDVMVHLAGKYGMHPNKVYESACFYSMIRTRPEGAVHVEVCRSAPCFVNGSKELIAAVEDNLGVSVGETSGDGKVTLACVECLGNCQAAPAMVVNGTMYPRVSPAEVNAILQKAMS